MLGHCQFPLGFHLNVLSQNAVCVFRGHVITMTEHLASAYILLKVNIWVKGYTYSTEVKFGCEQMAPSVVCMITARQ